VGRRTAELTATNEALRLQVRKRRQAEAILQARFRLSEHGLTHSLDELLTETLDEAEALTGSTLGFFHFVEADQRTIALQTWSTNTKARLCTAAAHEQHYPLERAGVWADCIRQRRPLAHNDYAAMPGRTGLPEGHALVVRELVIPIFRGESIVCVLGVGNKPTDYVEEDLEAVSQLANMAWDIVTAKRASVEKAALEQQLQQAQKMESVGRLAGGVAHDFNNMLGAILGHAELAMEQAAPETPLYEDLAQIQSAAQRSADLTRQLLAFARRQTVARRVLDLNATVEGMLKMLQRLIGEEIRLVWRPGSELWPVNIDPSQVDQLLANLCINARDAIGDFGAVTIATGNVTLEEVDCATIPGFIPGEYVRLVVADDGCGMDKETLTHLFEPFFTTKALGTGTGLGLATVYGAVKQNDGEIHVESEPGRGTTLTIYLPRHTGVGARDAPGPTPVTPASPPHETILVVEDEPAILRMTAKHLQKQGFAVLGAGSPGEALRKAREHVGEIHLLLSDVVMPEMNGRDLATALRATFPKLKRLFMSGYTADVIAHHGVVDGGVHFLQKPFSRAELLAKVRAVLDAKDG
jgi:signal transduction histidine kinase/ActR/RegA family two-component response regulator